MTSATLDILMSHVNRLCHKRVARFAQPPTTTALQAWCSSSAPPTGSGRCCGRRSFACALGWTPVRSPCVAGAGKEAQRRAMPVRYLHVTQPECCAAAASRREMNNVVLSLF